MTQEEAGTHQLKKPGEIMSPDQESLQEEQAEPEVIVDYEGQCPSLTGRSVLTYQAGRDPQSNEPLLRIARNSGGGMFSKDWTAIALIDAILEKADPVTARTLNEVHPNRSVNNGGFLTSILKDLGVVKAKDDNTRLHERVPGITVLQALAKRIAEANASEPVNKSRPKGKKE